MQILLNIVIFKTFTYNYGKTVLSKENLNTPSCFTDPCGPADAKRFRIK